MNINCNRKSNDLISFSFGCCFIKSFIKINYSIKCFTELVPTFCTKSFFALSTGSLLS